MPRPGPHIDAENLCQQLRQHLDGVLPRLTGLEGVVGVTLSGGVSRGYADHQSEIDVTLYVDAKVLADWERRGSPITMGISVIEGQLYDVKFTSLEKEKAGTWEDGGLWDASYAEVLYDPHGNVADLLREKLSTPVDSTRVEDYLGTSWWYLDLAVSQWVHRRDVPQGNVMLNQSVTPLVQALFVLNSEYVPHEKWLFHFSTDLDWQPQEWSRRLPGCVMPADRAVSGLASRQEIVRSLWVEIDTEYRRRHHPDLPIESTKRLAYTWLRQLVLQGEMTIIEWRSGTGEEIPNTDPFHAIMTVEGDRLLLDRDRFRSITAEDMYEWPFSVVEAVRSKLD